MSRGGAVGGPATLSSFRVQKAFSINFRENKRLRATIKLIEGEHMRSIRQVKQEITETKLWLEGVQESTGYSQHGIPTTERPSLLSPTNIRRFSMTPSLVSDKASPKPRPYVDQLGGTERDSHTRLTGPPVQDTLPPSHVRFAWTEQGPRKSQTDDLPSNTRRKPPPKTAGPKVADNRERRFSSSFTKNEEPNTKQVKPEQQKDNGSGRRFSSFTKNDEPNNKEVKPQHKKDDGPDDASLLYGGSTEPVTRLHSAASGRSNQSLTAYQRRRQLQSMMMKKRNTLDVKKDMNTKECVRVNSKVLDYIANLAERMKITLPDVSMFDYDAKKHDTPFAKDVNISD